MFEGNNFSRDGDAKTSNTLSYFKIKKRKALDLLREGENQEFEPIEALRIYLSSKEQFSEFLSQILSCINIRDYFISEDSFRDKYTKF